MKVKKMGYQRMFGLMGNCIVMTYYVENISQIHPLSSGNPDRRFLKQLVLKVSLKTSKS